jgi:uncharacterized membrane protein
MLGMVENVRKQPSRKQRMINICGWMVVVALGVWRVATRSHVTEFLDMLGIMVGIMCMFREISWMLQEPK